MNDERFQLFFFLAADLSLKVYAIQNSGWVFGLILFLR